MSNFEKSYKITRVDNEGGYANVSGDKGGETYAGISRRFYPGWEGWDYIDFMKRTTFQSGIPHNHNFPDIEYLVREFYRNYWDLYLLDGIDNDAVASLIFDYVVHSGTTGAKRIQRLLGVEPDGIFGPITISAINARNPNKLYHEILTDRTNLLQSLIIKDESQKTFERGWANRLLKFSAMAPINYTVVIAILILFLLFTLI